jgi:hypothetical protein
MRGFAGSEGDQEAGQIEEMGALEPHIDEPAEIADALEQRSSLDCLEGNTRPSARGIGKSDRRYRDIANHQTVMVQGNAKMMDVVFQPTNDRSIVTPSQIDEPPQPALRRRTVLWLG